MRNTSIRLPEEVFERAKREQRTVSDLVRAALESQSSGFDADALATQIEDLDRRLSRLEEMANV